MKVAGVILAGGQSRRMGGNEKSFLDVGGKTCLEWVASRFGAQVDLLALNANGDADRFKNLNLPILSDSIDGFVGPLAGVLAGMQWARQQSGVTHIITAASDTPFLPNNLLHRLTDELFVPNEIAMASSHGRIHPVFALWPIKLAEELQHFLVDEDKRKILEFANRYGLVEVVFTEEGADPFFNINTPEDRQKAEIMAREYAL